MLRLDKKDIGVFFDKWYNGTYPMNREERTTEFLRVKDLLAEVTIEPALVLDHGCGQGSWVPLLSSKFETAKIMGIEISRNGVGIASKQFPKQEFLLFDGETAPFAAGPFDLIFSWHVLDAVYDFENTASDMSRLLKKGGFLCIVMPCANEGSFEERVCRLIRSGKSDSEDGYQRFFYSYKAHIRRLQSKDAIALFSKNGLKLHEAFFSCHLWGGVEWLSSSGPAFIKSLFDWKRGVGVFAKCLLLVYLRIFLCLSFFRKLANVSILKQIDDANSKFKKGALVFLLSFKPIAVLFSSILRFLSRLEWRICKRHENGSSQYLIFTK